MAVVSSGSVVAASLETWGWGAVVKGLLMGDKKMGLGSIWDSVSFALVTL